MLLLRRSLALSTELSVGRRYASWAAAGTPSALNAPKPEAQSPKPNKKAARTKKAGSKPKAAAAAAEASDAPPAEPAAPEKMSTLSVPPSLCPSAVVMGGAQIVGGVTLGSGSSVWYNAVLRADVADIRVGVRSSVGDGCTITTSPEQGVEIGSDTVVSQNCTLQSCKVGSNVLIGPNCVIMAGAVVGDNSSLDPGTVIPPNTHVPDNTESDLYAPGAAAEESVRVLNLSQVHRRVIPDTSYVYGVAGSEEPPLPASVPAFGEDELPEEPPEWMRNLGS